MATHDLKQIWFNREINQRLEEVLRGIAASHLNIVENGMRFQNLKQDKRILRLANGIVIESSICFGKQTSRVYVPPVPPVKKKVKEEENVLIVSAYQEYTDTPVTWANSADSINGGYIRVYSAVKFEGEWVRDDLLHSAWSDPYESEGTAVLSGTVWTYTKHDESTWKMKFNTATNQWMFNINDDPRYASPSGKYIILATFYRNSIGAYYPRNYKGPEYEPLEAVGPGSYVMTVPYYRTEHTSEFNNISSSTTRFGTGLVAADGDTKTATRTVWATVPVKLNAGFKKSACAGNWSFYTEPWSEPESYLISYGKWGYRCSPPRSAGTYGWSNFWLLPSGNTDNGQAHIDEGVLTASADMEFYNGESTNNLTLRESHWNDARILVGYILDMGTFTVGWHNYLSDWIDPPAPVSRTGLPPYRDLRETTAYVKATYNEVTGIPWYAPSTGWGVTCYNTAESRNISILGIPNVFVSYKD